MIERTLPRWTGTAATAAILLATAITGVVKGGHTGEITAQLADWRDAAANAAGFRIASVAVVGRKQLTQDEVLAMGGVTGRSSLLFIDAATVRAKLKESPWIADATVLKLAINRAKVQLMCNALSNYDDRWLFQPMFISPRARRTSAYPCSTARDARGDLIVDEAGQPMADQFEPLY